MSYPDSTGPPEASIPFPSMHDILAASQCLSRFPPLDANESAVADNATLDTNEFWQGGGMQHLNATSTTFQEYSGEACMADAFRSNPVNHSRNGGSSSMTVSDINETKSEFSQTAERLLLQMEQFTFTIHRYSDSTNNLESKIDACNNSISNMEQRLNAIMHQMSNMEERVVSMNHRLGCMDERLVSLDLKLNTLDGYLLEIVKRERDIMKDFRDLPRN